MSKLFVVGVSGYSGSGKDEVYKALEGLPYHIWRMAFADAVKKEVSEACGIYVAQINADKPVFRPLLQWWGTEFRRLYCKNENYWVDKVRQGIAQLPPVVSAVIITDVRYLNEAQFVKSLGGTIWRITRPDLNAGTSHAKQHSSEHLAFPFDHELRNDGTLEEYHRRIRSHFMLQWAQHKHQEAQRVVNTTTSYSI